MPRDSIAFAKNNTAVVKHQSAFDVIGQEGGVSPRHGAAPQKVRDNRSAGRTKTTSTNGMSPFTQNGLPVKMQAAAKMKSAERAQDSFKVKLVADVAKNNYYDATPVQAPAILSSDHKPQQN